MVPPTPREFIYGFSSGADTETLMRVWAVVIGSSFQGALVRRRVN